MEKHKYHILFKENSESLHSRGTTIEAVDAQEALLTFFNSSILWNPDAVFLAMYNLEEMARLETLQNNQSEVNS